MKLYSIRWCELSITRLTSEFEFFVKLPKQEWFFGNPAEFNGYNRRHTTKKEVLDILKKIIKEKDNPRMKFISMTLIEAPNVIEKKIEYPDYNRYEIGRVNKRVREIIEKEFKKYHFPFTGWGYECYENKVTAEYTKGEQNYGMGELVVST